MLSLSQINSIRQLIAAHLGTWKVLVTLFPHKWVAAMKPPEMRPSQH